MVWSSQLQTVGRDPYDEASLPVVPGPNCAGSLAVADEVRAAGPGPFAPGSEVSEVGSQTHRELTRQVGVRSSTTHNHPWGRT